MSRAFQCDNCAELFPGDAHEVLANGAEVCSGCFRALKALATIDPFVIRLRNDREVDWSRTDFPLHTGRHSQ